MNQSRYKKVVKSYRLLRGLLCKSSEAPIRELPMPYRASCSAPCRHSGGLEATKSEGKERGGSKGFHLMACPWQGRVESARNRRMVALPRSALWATVVRRPIGDEERGRSCSPVRRSLWWPRLGPIAGDRGASTRRSRAVELSFCCTTGRRGKVGAGTAGGCRNRKVKK